MCRNLECWRIRRMRWKCWQRVRRRIREEPRRKLSVLSARRGLGAGGGRSRLREDGDERHGEKKHEHWIDWQPGTRQGQGKIEGPRGDDWKYRDRKGVGAAPAEKNDDPAEGSEGREEIEDDDVPKPPR